MSSVGNLQLMSVGKLKLSAPTTLLTHDAAAEVRRLRVREDAVQVIETFNSHASTSERIGGRIVFGLSVRPSVRRVRACVCASIRVT